MIHALRPAALSAFLSFGLAAAAVADPVTVETARGPVTLPAVPERVIVFDMAALDTLDALGVVPVGVTDNTYLPALAHVREHAEPVGTLFEPNMEAVAALGPDLIIIGGRSAAQYDALSRIAPVIDMTIDAKDGLVPAARERILAYGEIFGKVPEATELATVLDGAVAKARAAVADKGKALVVLTNGTRMSVFGPGSRFGWVHGDLDLPAATATVDEGSHGEGVSAEFIRQANPDWLIVVDRAAAVGQAGDSARQTLDNPLVGSTTAWQKQQIVYLDPTSTYIANGGARALTGLLGQITEAFAK